MLVKDVLADIDFGSGSADREPDLHSHFLRTSAFDDFVNDQIDILLGAKGTGKTAIFQLLSDTDFAIPTLDRVDIIPAFSLKGALPIARLAEKGVFAKDFEFRRAWKAFAAAAVANHVVDSYDGSLTRVVDDSLAVLGLRPRRAESKDIWRLLLSGPEILLQHKDFGIAERDEDDLEALLVDADAVLRSSGRAAWLVFDRLDESFGVDPEIQRSALRSLLQATRDINSLGLRIQLKLLARDDIIRQASEDAPLVNMDHLRSHTIEWAPSDLREMLCERLVRSHAFSTVFKVGVRDLGLVARRNAMLRALIPVPAAPMAKFPGVANSGIDWVTTATLDGTGLASPRNVLALLRLARTEDSRLTPEKGVEVEDSLLSPLALNRAWVKLSKERLSSVVVAGDPGCAPLVEALDGCPREFRSDVALAGRLGVDESEMATAKERLIDAGVLRPLREGRLSVSCLYWPALRVEAH